MPPVPLHHVTIHGHEVSYPIGGLVDPGGQTVSALDRIYLAGGLPTLIIWGDQDPIVPIEHGHAAHAAIAGSRLEILKGCGHSPHVEEPRRFVGVLDDFLATTEAGDEGPEGYRDLLLAHSEAPSATR